LSSREASIYLLRLNHPENPDSPLCSFVSSVVKGSFRGLTRQQNLLLAVSAFPDLRYGLPNQ
jgi:hypothetical protein